MGCKDYFIITNNPLVPEELKDTENVIYLSVSCKGILKAVRDSVYKGCRVLSHPLAGNIKPGVTPYKSVMISGKKGRTDISSLKMIEGAISFCGGAKEEPGRYFPRVLKDFQLIDSELLKSAVESAGH